MSALADPWVPVALPVIEVVRELADTVTIVLDASAHPMPFAPGQLTMLYRHGLGEVPISISGDPGEPERLVHTIRAVGRVTRPLVEVQLGEQLGVRGPYGTAWPVEQARGQDVVLVAGGIGLAPLRPVLYHLLRNRADYGRVVLLVGSRSPETLLFAEQLHAWRARFDLEVDVTVDVAAPGWHGPVGVVTRLLEQAPLDPTRTVLMTCGPEVMMRFVVREALRRQIPAERLFVSMERSMKCAVGLCGHCQWGPDFVCKDGPVFPWSRVGGRFAIREL